MSKRLFLLGFLYLTHFFNMKVAYPAILIPGNKISWDPTELNLLSSVVLSAIIFPITSATFPKFNLKISLTNVSNYLWCICQWLSLFYMISPFRCLIVIIDKILTIMWKCDLLRLLIDTDLNTWVPLLKLSVQIFTVTSSRYGSEKIEENLKLESFTENLYDLLQCRVHNTL